MPLKQFEDYIENHRPENIEKINALSKLIEEKFSDESTPSSYQQAIYINAAYLVEYPFVIGSRDSEFEQEFLKLLEEERKAFVIGRMDLNQGQLLNLMEDKKVDLHSIELKRSNLKQKYALSFLYDYGIMPKQIVQAYRASQESFSHVLILGPRGSGKSSIASFIHANIPFNGVKNIGLGYVNIAAYDNPTNFLADLLGTGEKIYTGVAKRTGILKKYAGSTVFIDEIGKANKLVQQAILHLLEKKSYTPLGEHTELPLECRLIFAANENLNKLPEDIFLPDLFDRLNVITIKTASLFQLKPYILHFFYRMLKQNIMDFCKTAADLIPAFRSPDKLNLLIEHEYYRILGELYWSFSDQTCSKLKFVENHILLENTSKIAESFISSYTWPGNFRELSNYIERGLVTGNWVGKFNDLIQDEKQMEVPAETEDNIPPFKEYKEIYFRKLMQTCKTHKQAEMISGLGLSTIKRSFDKLKKSNLNS